MPSALFTRPSHDYTTRYLSAWSAASIDLAHKKQCLVFDLAGTRARKKELESFLLNKHPSLVILNGHGDADTICGDADEPLVKVGDNERLLQNTIVYALACASAKWLGPSCVRNGTRAYLGYSDDFIFMYSTAHRTNPVSDPIANLFAEPSNLIPTTLLKGHPAGEAHARSQRAFRRTTNHLLTSETKPAGSATLRYLLWDMQHQVCLGDQNARIADA